MADPTATLFHNATLITPFRTSPGERILVRGGRIAEIGPHTSVPPDAERVDCAGAYLVPGFIDLHINGAGGHDFVDNVDEAIDRICGTVVRYGTTGLLMTAYSQPPRQYWRDLDRLARYCDARPPDSIVQGIHLEGPFLSHDMPGCWQQPVFWKPDVADWHRLYDASHGHVRIMTIAPELPGAMAIMRDAATRAVELAMGHSAAPHEIIEVAIDNGLTQVTHIFNAMRPMHHRHPSVVTEALLREELKVHVIADGVHVHPAMLRLLWKIKGTHGIVLVSDAIRACGMPDGAYRLGTQQVELANGRATLPDGTLAGSILTMDQAVRVMVNDVGVPLTDAVRMASLNPARILRLDGRKGILGVGKDADLVLLDPDLQVVLTMVAGRIVYRRDDA